ncbi:MAG TPA: CHAT domain-containing protein [Pyrinomonadaceae bacterium]|nr:CHAT domain-containing protein [Pyrinomonadaceae bacterium]
MEYLDFEVEMSPGNWGEYMVSVRSSPAGETHASERLHLPFDEQGLQVRLKQLEIAILHSQVKTLRHVPSATDREVQSFGQELFTALIKGEVRSRYETSRGIANHEGKGLRIKLRIRAPQLNVLPWEFLYDPNEHRYISLSIRTPVVRYLNLPQPPSPMGVSPPLKILGMAVSPSGKGALGVEQEKNRMSEAIKPLQDSGMVELVWVQGKTWRDLQNQMQRASWHVFHFIGHGGFDIDKDEGGIKLAEADGSEKVLNASELAMFLGDHPSLRLILLNSCEGATSSSKDMLSSTAAILMTNGIPAVVAMQYQISDVAAIEFSQAFYGAIANGLPVDTAVTEGRKAIRVGGGNTVEWGTPVLCMRSPDGKIFDVSRINEELKSKKVSEYLNAAQEASTQGNWEVALQKTQSVLALEPGHKGASESLPQIQKENELAQLYSGGKAKLAERKWQEALTFFQQVHDKKSDYKDVKDLMATCHKKLNHVPILLAWRRRITTSLRSVVESMRRNRRRLLQVMIGLLIVGVAGVGVWWFTRPVAPGPDPPPPQGEDKQTAERISLKVERIDELKPEVNFLQLALSRDGKTLACAGFDNYVPVYLRDSSNSLVGLRERELTGYLTSVAFSPNGKTVAAGDPVGAIRLWDLPSKTNFGTMRSNRETVFALSFSNDGQILVSATFNNATKYKTVSMWRTDNGDKIRDLVQVGPENTILAVNAQRTLVAVQTDNQELQLWAFNDGQETKKITVHTASQAVIGEIDSTGQWLAVPDKSGVIRVWSVDNNNKVTRVAEMPTRNLDADAIALSPNGKSIAVGWNDGNVTVWSQPFTNNAPSFPFQTAKGSVTLAFDESGEILAEGHSSLLQKKLAVGHFIRLWRIKKEISK